MEEAEEQKKEVEVFEADNQSRLLLLALCILLASFLFASENAQGSGVMIHSTPNG